MIGVIDQPMIGVGTEFLLRTHKVSVLIIGEMLPDPSHFPCHTLVVDARLCKETYIVLPKPVFDDTKNVKPIGHRIEVRPKVCP